MNFDTITSLFTLTALVVLFRTILQQGTTEPGLFWLAGWTLVLIHFVAQFVDVGQVLWTRIAAAISLDALELASIAFLVSVSRGASDRRRQLLLAAVIGIPAVVYTDAVIWDVAVRSLYYAVIALALTGALLVIWDFYGTITPYVVGMWIGCVGLSCAVAWAVMRGKLGLGIVFLLTALNFIVAVLFWRRFRRATVGVLTTVLGFVAWGAVFPAGMLLGTLAPSIHVGPEVWNIPKYFVAVGMIFVLLEDQLRTLEYLASYSPILLDQTDGGDLRALIAGGESATLEFKSSLRWALRESKVNHALEAAVLKTLAGYMNGDGGTLLIGVADDGTIVGLDNDYQTLKKRDRDGFEQSLMTAIATKMGSAACDLVRMAFHSLDDRDLCRVMVARSRRAVYVREGGNPKLYLRTGVITRELNVEEAINYRSERSSK